MKTICVITIILFSTISDLTLGYNNNINNNNNNNNNNHTEVWYYDLPPYIYTDENDKIVGMFATYLEVITKRCFKELSKKNITIVTTYTKFKTDKTMGSRQNHTFSFPVIRGNNNSIFGDDIAYESEQLFSSKSVAVLVQTNYINFAYKFLVSFLNIKILLALIFFGALITAMLIWVLEIWLCDEFSRCFVKGVGSALWLAFVTMTSVGYGDVVPRVLPARTVAVAWMMFGLIIASLTIASTTQGYMTADTIELEGKKIAILNGSYEAQLIKESYSKGHTTTEFLGYNTYDDVLDAVRQGEAFAAIINSDVASYIQDTMNDNLQNERISVIRTRDIEVPVTLYIAKHKSYDFSKCRAKHNKRAIQYAIFKHQRKIFVETIHRESIGRLFLDNKWVLYASMGVIVLIVCGLLFDLTKWTTERANQGIRARCRRNYTASTIHKNALKKFDIELFYMKKEVTTIKLSLIQLQNILEKQTKIQGRLLGKNETLI